MKQVYDELGLDTIPVAFNQKYPPPKNWQKESRQKLWDNVSNNFNIALRLGDVVDLESDNLSSEAFIKQRLHNLGIHNSPTCVSRRGRHHFLKINNSPENISFTNWKPDVGKGEARIRNCYSLIPNSEIKSFQYYWNNDWYSGFKDIPVINWSDISDMVVNNSPTTQQANTSLVLPRYLKFDVEPWVYIAFEKLKNAKKGLPIRVNESKSYASRSETEAAIITRLDTCGYSLEKISGVFDKYQPGHFRELSDYRYTYLTNIYNSIQGLEHRPSISTAYYGITGDLYRDRILRIILSVCHQLNRANCYLSLEQICDFMSLPKNRSGTYSKAGPNKAIRTLEKHFKLSVKRGIHSLNGRSGTANTYDISNVLPTV